MSEFFYYRTVSNIKMKKNLLGVFIILVVSACVQNKKMVVFGDENNQLSFKYINKNLGVIKEGELVEFDYEFTNTGKTPISIINVVPTCGCVLAEFQNTPIPPNNKGKIKVTFNSKDKEGINEKSIVVQTNLANPNDIIVLSFKVDVKTQ